MKKVFTRDRRITPNEKFEYNGQAGLLLFTRKTYLGPDYGLNRTVVTGTNMSFLQKINDGFTHFLSQGDPRVNSWPMMQSPFPGCVLIVAYIYFVKVAGPNWMKKRKAFDLRNTMLLYNFMMVFVNLHIFLELGRYGWFNNYSLRCEPVDYSNNYEAVRIAEIGWLYYVTKFVEFADTIFFVLRKKYSHISPLHVIHHSVVPFSLWFGIKFAPGGYNALFPFLNSFVHVLMYSYYGLAALGPQIQKYLIWKKYITFIQMGQFLCIVLYTAHLMCFGNCEISNAFIFANAFHAVLFFFLFWDFFRKAYTARARGRLSTRPKTEDVCPVEPEVHLNGEKSVPKRNEIAMPSHDDDGEDRTQKTLYEDPKLNIRQRDCEATKIGSTEIKNGHFLEFKMKISTDFFSLYDHRNKGNMVKNGLIMDSSESQCPLRNRNGCVEAR